MQHCAAWRHDFFFFSPLFLNLSFIQNYFGIEKNKLQLHFLPQGSSTRALATTGQSATGVGDTGRGSNGKVGRREGGAGTKLSLNSTGNKWFGAGKHRGELGGANRWAGS